MPRARRYAFRLLIGISILIMSLAALTTLQGPVASSHIVTLETEPVALLLPHGHRTGDTVLSADHGVMVASLPQEIIESVWVGEASVKVKNAPYEIIHHMGLFLVRDGVPGETALFFVGQDTSSFKRFPRPSGILLEEGDTIVARGMFHNPVPPLGEGGIYENVSVEVTLSGTNPDDAGTPLNFTQVVVTDMGSEHDEQTMFTVPPGSYQQVKRSEDNPHGAAPSFTFQKDGWIVSMGAHMHAWEGAKQVDAYLNGRHLRTFTSRRADENVSWSFKTESGPLYTRVRAGDTVTVSTTYSNPGETAIEGAMGIIGFFYTQEQPRTLTWWWSLKSWYYGALRAFFD